MAEAKKAVKQPEDHKPKVEKAKVDKVEIEVGAEGAKRTIPASRISISGIVVTVPEEALDDFEFLDDLRSLQDNEDASRLPALLRRLVVAEDYRRVLEALRDPATGRVSVEAGSSFVMSLIEALNPSS